MKNRIYKNTKIVIYHEILFLRVSLQNLISSQYPCLNFIPYESSSRSTNTDINNFIKKFPLSMSYIENKKKKIDKENVWKLLAQIEGMI